MNENNPNNNQNGEPPHNPAPPFQPDQPQNTQQPYPGPGGYPPPPPYPPYPPYHQYDTEETAKLFSVLAYIPFLWLVGLFADRYNPKVKFHVNQGIILTIFTVIFRVVISFLQSFFTMIFTVSFSGTIIFAPLGVMINGLLSLAGWGLFIAFAIIGIIHAAQDRQEPLPVIGTLFQVLK